MQINENAYQIQAAQLQAQNIAQSTAAQGFAGAASEQEAASLAVGASNAQAAQAAAKTEQIEASAAAADAQNAQIGQSLLGKASLLESADKLVAAATSGDMKSASAAQSELAAKLPAPAQGLEDLSAHKQQLALAHRQADPAAMATLLA